MDSGNRLPRKVELARLNNSPDSDKDDGQHGALKHKKRLQSRISIPTLSLFGLLSQKWLLLWR